MIKDLFDIQSAVYQKTAKQMAKIREVQVALLRDIVRGIDIMELMITQMFVRRILRKRQWRHFQVVIVLGIYSRGLSTIGI